MSTLQQDWGRNSNGDVVSLFTLENAFLRVQVTNQGAALVSVVCPDRDGNSKNVVVDGNGPETYLDNSSYLGATVGRFANRIRSGKFWLDGKEFTLPNNNGHHHLHGGLKGLSRHLWASQLGENSVTFTTSSPAGEDGYPGRLDVSVAYRIDDHVLSIDYCARSDAPTVVNLTNHAYWNLAGTGSVLNHQLELCADSYLEVDSNILPTGNILEVAGTAFDFRVPESLGRSIDQTGGGYDHCFVVRNWDGNLRLVARAAELECGRVMEVHSTTPGVQLYTANHFDGSNECGNHQRHEAFCLECQHFPDSPNQMEFPSTALRPGEEYRQRTEHRFYTVR